METGKVLTSAMGGTAAMSLFSYVVSNLENKNFREPEILAHLIKRLSEKISKEEAEAAGWAAHYAAGILFVAVYNELWKREKIKPSVASGAILGAVSGLAGIMIWSAVFKLHPNPPAKNLKPYFEHLMMAHVVFGISCALTYKASARKKLESTIVD